jgi:FkbM family methyltransferase
MNAKRMIEAIFPKSCARYRMKRDLKIAQHAVLRTTPFVFRMAAPGKIDAEDAESGAVGVFLNCLKGADVFIDIGANCGFFTLLALAQQGIQCVAVEPNDLNIRLLLRNLQENRFLDVEVLPVALGSNVTILPLFGGGEGASLLPKWGGIGPGSNYSTLVPVNSLDNIFHSRVAGKNVVIKIDVEGNEYNVLQGATHLLGMQPSPVWIIEHGFRENFDGQVNPHFRQLFEVFWHRGYTCRTMDKDRRIVTRKDVERWLKTDTRDFGFLNYVFASEHS